MWGGCFYAPDANNERGIFVVDSDIYRQQGKTLSNTEKMVLYNQEKKDETMGLILSLFFGGFGLMYAGKIGRGILVLIFFWTIVAWIYGIVATRNTISEHNSKLYLALFGSERPEEVKEVESTSDIMDEPEGKPV